MALTALGLATLVLAVWSVQQWVYQCEHETGGVPVKGCAYYAEVVLLNWDEFPSVVSGLSLNLVGLGVLVLDWALAWYRQHHSLDTLE